jgi:NTE family protein
MTSLFVEGGGVRSVALLGVVQWLEQTGRTLDVCSVTCYSFGSIIGVAIALKRAPRDVVERIVRSAISRTTRIGAILCTALSSHRARMSRSLRVEIDAMVPRGMTLAGLKAQTGIDVRILVVALEAGQTVTLDAQNSPDVSLVDAVLASCAIPSLFEPVCINGVRYVDGGALGGFQDPAPRNATVLVMEPFDSFTVCGNESALTTYYLLMNRHRSRWLKRARRAGALVISVEGTASTPVGATEAECNELFARGFIAASETE